MTDPTPWERLDAPAATPHSIAADHSTAAAGTAAARRSRLVRDRSPVLAAFDAGGDAFQRHLRTVLVGSAALLGPLVALNVWVTIVGFDRFDPDDALFPSIGSGTRSGIEDVAPFAGAVATSIATAIVGFFVASVVLADRLGARLIEPGSGFAAGSRPTTALGPNLAHTVRSLPRLLAMWVVGHWWQPVLVLLVLSGDEDSTALIVIVLAPIALLASSATLYAVPAMVAEGSGPVASLRRAWGLFRRASGSAVLVVMASTLLGGLLLVGVATIAPLLEANGFIGFGGAAWLVQGLMVQLGVLLVVPLVAACTAQSYVEVRLDREALDLRLAADDAFGANA